MLMAELRDALAIKDGTVTISIDKLNTPGFIAFLDAYYNGQSITITNATPGPGNGANQVVIQGTAPFLNVKDLPVLARFSLDDQGTISAALDYTLIDLNPGPNRWTFSTSFPDLPISFDYRTSIVAPQRSVLDRLLLTDSHLIVTTGPSTDPRSGVELEPGINFVGKMAPTGILGVFESIFQETQPLTLYGSIRIPRPTDITPPLPPYTFPYDLPAPGINLKARLDVAIQLGPMAFRDVFFKIYSPISAAWLKQNQDYQPVMAYVGELDIPSAGISVQIAAKQLLGDDELLLAGAFDGITLQKLASLADVAGTDALIAAMPGEIKQAGDTLGRLELQSASVGLAAANRSYRVTSTSFTVGMPDLHWAAIPEHIEIDSIVARFFIGNPFDSASRSLSIALIGGLRIMDVPLEVIVEAPGFSIYASLEQPQTIPLRSLLARYLPDVPPPGDLTINYMSVYAQPGVSYSIAITIADDPPWVLDVGPSNLTISDVGLMIAYTPGRGSSSGSRSTTGSFSGMIVFDEGAQIAARYDIPGDFLVRGNLPTVTLAQLIEKLCDQTIELPPGFDITFVESSVLIQKQGATGTFLLATEVENAGSLAFEARKLGGWGFAVGLDLSLGKLSSLPGLDALSVFEETFGLQKLLLVVSSLQAIDFQFPDLAAFNNPRIGAKRIALPGSAGGLQAGLNLYAEMKLGGSRQQDLVRKFLGLPADATLDIVLQIGANPAQNARLFAAISGKINDATTLNGQFGAMVQGGEFGLFLIGKVKTSIQSQPLEFDVTMLLVENGAFLSGTMLGTIKFWEVQLSNLALEIGIDFEGIPSLGIAASIDIATFDSSIAVFFDSSDPAKSMVAGALSDLTLKDVVDALAGSAAVPPELDEVLATIGIKGVQTFSIPGALADALDNLKIDLVAGAFQQYGHVTIPASQQLVLLVVNQKGAAWHLTDLQTMKHYELKKSADLIAVSLEAQFYCAPQDTYIGQIHFPQGFRVDGTIELLDQRAVIAVEINPNQGIAADVTMTPITIYRPEFLSITGHDGQGGPALSVATFVQDAQPKPEFRPPHLFLSGSVHLLGAVGADIFVSISKRGFHFDLKGELVAGTNFNLFADFDSLTSFGGGGKAIVGMRRPIDLGPLGRIDLDTSVDGQVGLGYTSGVAHADLAGQFVFQDTPYTIARFDLDTGAAPLAHLADILSDKITALFKATLSDARQWLDWVHQGIIKGIDNVDQIADVLNHQYGKSSEEAARLLKDAGYGIGEIAEGLKSAYGMSADGVASVLKSLGYGTDEIVGTLQDVFGLTEKALRPIRRALHVDTWTIPPINTSTPPVDYWTISHGDTTAPPVDTWTIPPINTSTPPVDYWTIHHTDVWSPRVNYWTIPHIDSSAPHGDTRFFGSHTDIGGHADTLRAGHVDTPAIHSDTPQAGHVDTGGHADTPGVGHVDTPAVHSDTPQAGHVDTGGHADTPGVGHVDTP